MANHCIINAERLLYNDFAKFDIEQQLKVTCALKCNGGKNSSGVTDQIEN
ncbi:MAG: hypothetical protein RR444_07685 [Oscillospiraceae bacterium]